VGGHLGIAGVVQPKLVYEDVAEARKAPCSLHEAHEAQGVGGLLKGEEGLGAWGLPVGGHQEVGLAHAKAPVQIDALGARHPGPEEAPGAVVDPASQARLGQGLGGVAGVRVVGGEGGPPEAGGRGEAFKKLLQVDLGVALREAHRPLG